MNKRMLIVAPDFPYPPNHGGRADMMERLKSISKKFDIDLIVATKEPLPHGFDEEIKKYVKNVYFCTRKSSWRSMLSLKPMQVKSRNGLEKIRLQSSSYDILLMEGEYVCEILNNKSLIFNKIYLRVHNNETAYFMALCKASKGLKKIYYFLEAKRFYLYKKNVYKKIENFLYISKDEYEASGEAFKYWLPPTVEREYKSLTIQGDTALYVGSLFMPNNVWGLKWYLDNVHESIVARNKSYKLIIAGNTKGKSISWLDSYKNVSFIDSPSDEDLEKIYQSSAVFVAPIFHGSGVKLKIINAIVEGVPIVTTSIGGEGTGLVNNVHLSIADDEKEFCKAVLNKLVNKDEALNEINRAQDVLANHYGPSKILSILGEA